MIRINVEFYGIPRQRTGVANTVVELSGDGAQLADLFRSLAKRFPRLAGECIQNGQLAAGYSANLAGQKFITDTKTVLSDGATLLIMSSDAGG